MRSAPVPIRSLAAAALALVLALRLLTPVDYMPAFERGALTIIACPDADGAASAALIHHHHGGSKSLHQTCPYAAASGLGGLAADFCPLLDIVILALAVLLGRSLLFFERHAVGLRPPSRGPPIPA